MTLPLALIPVLQQQFFNDQGVPLTDGALVFYETGTSTPAAVYADQDGTTSLGSTVDLDSAGRAPEIYLQPIGYTVEIIDSDAVVQYTINYVADVGSLYLSTWGIQQAQGTSVSSTPYSVTDTDNLIKCYDGADRIILPLAANRGVPLVIKNFSAGIITVAQDGGETLEDLDDAYEMPVSSSPLIPTITLISDGVSAWYITGALGLG